MSLVGFVLKTKRKKFEKFGCFGRLKISQQDWCFGLGSVAYLYPNHLVHQHMGCALKLGKKKKFIRFFRTLWFKLLIASSLNYWPRFTLQHFCLMSFNISHLWLSCYSYGFVSTLCLNENRLCRSKKAWWVKTHH